MAHKYTPNACNLLKISHASEKSQWKIQKCLQLKKKEDEKEQHFFTFLIMNTSLMNVWNDRLLKQH